MKKETIDNLKRLRLGEKLSSNKGLSDEEKELQDTLEKLKNIGVLKLSNNAYSVGNHKLLSKFIELQCFEKLVEYIELESESQFKSITNNGILIQDSRLEKSPIKQMINNESISKARKKSLFKRILSNKWVIGIVLLIITAIFNTERIRIWIDSCINQL